MAHRSTDSGRDEAADNVMDEINASLGRIDLEEDETPAKVTVSDDANDAFKEDIRDAFGNRTHTSRAESSTAVKSQQQVKSAKEYKRVAQESLETDESKGQARLPVIEITPDDVRAEFRAGILVGLGVLAAICLAAVTWWVNASGPDQHFLTAQKWQTGYERGKLDSERNYGHPVYAKIVRELGLVDSRSISAEPAAAMADEIQAQIQAFMQKQVEIKENRNKNTYERNQKIFEAQRRARIMPVEDTTECDEE